MVSVAGEFRVSRLVKFITENWVVPGEDGAILGFGSRLISRSLTAELAGIVPTIADDLYVFPLVSFAYHW